MAQLTYAEIDALRAKGRVVKVFWRKRKARVDGFKWYDIKLTPEEQAQHNEDMATIFTLEHGHTGAL